MSTAEDILSQFDHCAGEFDFPMLDNGYVYPADTRLLIYRDQTNWLMIIEVLGASSPRVSAFDSFQNCLHLFGSALHRDPGTANEDFLYPLSGCPDAPLFADEYDWFARADAHCVMLREARVELNLDADYLKQKGIELLEPPQKDPPAILRSLIPEHRSSLLASEAELAKRNPHNLPLWLQLDDWHHPDLTNKELPSESETFQMLADAIASGDKAKYRPTKSPNTHWSNWPEGGTL